MSPPWGSVSEKCPKPQTIDKGEEETDLSNILVEVASEVVIIVITDFHVDDDNT